MMANSYEIDGQPRYGQRLSPEEFAVVRAQQGLDPLPAPETPSADSPLEIPEGPSTGWKAPAGGVSLERWTDPAAARRRRRPTKRRRTLWVGLVLTLVVPALLLFTAVNISVDWSGAHSTVVGASGHVYLDAGTHAMLYAGASEPTHDCTITDPEGSVVTKDKGQESLPFASFVAPTSGTYTVTCPKGTEGVIVGPPMRASRLLTATGIVVGAFLCGITGLAVTVVGLSRLRHPKP